MSTPVIATCMYSVAKTVIASSSSIYSRHDTHAYMLAIVQCELTVSYNLPGAQIVVTLGLYSHAATGGSCWHAGELEHCYGVLVIVAPYIKAIAGVIFIVIEISHFNSIPDMHACG